MSGDFAQTMDIASKIATVGAFAFTTGTFWFLYFRRRKSEEYGIANDIAKSLTEMEHKILEEDDAKQKVLRHKQYLNVWEWFALMVNNEELKNDKILEHFKPLFISDYKQYSEVIPELKDKTKDDFRQIKRLYEKWTVS
jgi:hypothetical protein